MEANEKNIVSFIFSVQTKNGKSIYINSIVVSHGSFGWGIIVCSLCQMLPLLKRSTDNLVAVIEEKATSEETFEVFKYVYSSSCDRVHVYHQEHVI